MVIFGWLSRFTILGIKVDECSGCGMTCEHVVGRKTNWGHVFWFPVLFLGFSHGMACTTCRAWTGIPWAQVRAAMKSGSLPLDRLRANAPEVLAAVAGENEPPVHPALYDNLLVNPKRGPWDLYLKLWPVLAAIAVVAVLGNAILVPPRVLPSDAKGVATAHTCWEDTDGTILGCRLATGELEGATGGHEVTCFFVEPVTADTRMRCGD